MKRHMERARDQLGELAGLVEKTRRTEQRILEQAEKRLDEVQAAIARARPGIEAAPSDAQRRYQELVAERGQLNMVIAQARETLGK